MTKSEAIDEAIAAVAISPFIDKEEKLEITIILFDLKEEE